MTRKIAACLCLLAIGGAAWAADGNIPRGLTVCVGAGALKNMANHWPEPGCVFHGLVTSEEEASGLRAEILKAGCYGKVSVAKFDGKRLPYINNLVNLLIVGEGFDLADAEVRRVLAPYGTAVVGEKSFTKPYPDSVDEWPQYLHGADNNCVAQDTVVGPPRHVQWISNPAWTRAHIGAATISSMVSSGGRLFTIEDTETAENPLLPAKWKLIARNAFNGIVLWTMDYPTWEQVTVYIKNYHAQMQRRLVAIGDTVYCTPGLKAPVTALDAGTGKVRKRYEGTAGTQEFALHDGWLYAVVGDRMHFASYRGTGPANSNAAQQQKKKRRGQTPEPPVANHRGEVITYNGDGFPLSLYNPQTPNAENPRCRIIAIDTGTGNEVWRSDEIANYTGCSMALRGDRLVYQCTQGVFCLNAKTGEQNWAVRKTIPYGRGSSPFTVVLSDHAVYSEEGPSVFAYSLADGSDYWGKSIKARKGYQASTDLLIVDGALWMCGACNNPQGIVTQKPTAYDLETGDELRTLNQVLSKPMGHDRCFRNFITERFFIDSKTGGPDCLDFKTGAEYPAPFTRATCSMGPLPCNGLIYCGPYACQCHLPVALHYFNAYYTDEQSLQTQGQVVKVERSVRLEKGPAYGYQGEPADAPWPTYRQDGRRYSSTALQVPPAGLEPVWKAQLASPVTAPTIADGKLFVAETDAHTLRALDADTGELLWSYTAGGRIDSPPTYYRGLLLFGCQDGWVYCVRASDGVLAWRFRDLPDALICAFDQLESAWPVHGSVLIANDTAYFCAGRTSYLDGGLFIYGLDPVSGEILHQRQFYGPYGEDGFPRFVEEGNRSETEVILGTTADVMSCEGDTLYIRQQAFHLDLTDAVPDKHLLASAGMLESHRQHREYKLVQEDFNHRKMWTTENTPYPTGDIIVADGVDYYSVFGVPVNRGDTFNPRHGYLLTAKTKTAEGWKNKWTARIPLTGKAMALVGDVVYVAGAPLVFNPPDVGATYAGRLGGVLWAVSAADGTLLAEYQLDVLPAWDGMAAAAGRLYLVNQDGSIACWGKQPRQR